ncbi:MAG TPA: 5'-nucleotidase C-terminal domain-containing protein [Bacteroidia bacterium]|jgi:2',3'-cyclic-nucleotide 2'-phosphodiesterase (5'-nucleotidase family)
MKQLQLQYSIAFLSIALLLGCSGSPKLKSVTTGSTEFNQANSAVDSTSYKLIAPYKKEMDRIMNEVLAVSDSALTKDLPEGSLGNFVSDAVLKKTNDLYRPEDKHPADICLLNNGGLRAQLPKGNITRGNAFELMPFENSIVILTISGQRMQQLFQSLVNFNGAPFAGANVRAKDKKIIELNINGLPFDPGKNYKVVTSDYLAAGGDKYEFFKDPLKTDTLNYKLRDAIIDYMTEENKKGNKIKSRKDGRIKLE